MNTIYKIAVIIFLIAVLVGIGYLISDKTEFGSVNVTAEYQATSTAQMTGALVKATEYNHLVKASTYGSVTLGSIVVASTTAHAMNIYNATSTDAVADGTYGTFITRLSSSTPRGTYTYDIEMNAGLVVQLQAGYTGDYVVTYR